MGLLLRTLFANSFGAKQTGLTDEPRNYSPPLASTARVVSSGPKSSALLT
jgi:hypothetical protein